MKEVDTNQCWSRTGFRAKCQNEQEQLSGPFSDDTKLLVINS